MKHQLAAWLLHLSDRIESAAYWVDDRAWTHRWSR